MIHILSFLGRVLDTHRDEYMQFLLELKQGVWTRGKIRGQRWPLKIGGVDQLKIKEGYRQPSGSMDTITDIMCTIRQTINFIAQP